MFSISWLKSSSLWIGSFGIEMRPKWLVTPRGAMASNSGCTGVLVEGAITANLRSETQGVGHARDHARSSARGHNSCDHRPMQPQRFGMSVAFASKALASPVVCTDAAAIRRAGAEPSRWAIPSGKIYAEHHQHMRARAAGSLLILQSMHQPAIIQVIV